MPAVAVDWVDKFPYASGDLPEIAVEMCFVLESLLVYTEICRADLKHPVQEQGRGSSKLATASCGGEFHVVHRRYPLKEAM